MRATCLTALLCLTLLSRNAPAADWVRVETPNFIVYGETGERRVREVAAEFERFREALARVVPGAATPAAVPTVVVVFDSQKSFEPYRPRFNGKPVQLGGYFFASEDMNIVALADTDRDEAIRTVFHEYVHLVIDNVGQNMPVWLNEGLAEYYSTFAVENDGRRAIIGKIIPSHLYLLNENKLLPISELLAVEQTSKAYNEGERRSIFYAESWALVHMLVTGTQNRSADLSKYAALVANGTPSLTAWQQVFGQNDLIKQLSQYVQRDVMRAFLFRFDRAIPKVSGDLSAVSESDAQATLADLLRRVAPREETAARFESVLALQPPSARARALFGLFELTEDDGKSTRLLLEAGKDTSDWLVQYHVATGLTRLASPTDGAETTVSQAARAALANVFSARPDLPNAHALDARLEVNTSGDLDKSLKSILRARELVPGREDYALLESYIRTRRGEYTAARSLLAPLLTSRYPTAIRDNARTLMGHIVTLEQMDADYVAKLEGKKPAADVPAASGQRLVPDYRRLQQGEQRMEGVLERIQCSQTGVVLLLRTGDTLERFDMISLNGVDFITYRNDLKGAISCGPRPSPEPVYVTWRASGASSRVVVAVEFLPARE